MKIIEPSVEYWEQEDVIKHVARCARVCYKREKGNDEVTYNNLLKNKHWSMFRHATYYFIIPRSKVPDWIRYYYVAIQNEANIIGIDIKFDYDYYYVVTNGSWNLDHQDLLYTILGYQVEAKEFANANEIAWNMMRYTFKIITQISTSRELNRVSPNSIAEKSTRYVYENGTICRPHWMSKEEAEVINKSNGDFADLAYDDRISSKVYHYVGQCKSSFDNYKYLIDEEEMTRQDARGVLPLDTATACVYTYSIPEWRHIIELRADVKHAHPNAVIIANMIKKELNYLGYDL